MDAIDIFLYLSYGLFIGSLIAIVLLSVFNAAKEPKSLVKGGIAIAAFLVVFFIAFSISGDEVTTRFAAAGVSASMSKLIGGALITMYVILIGGFLSIVYSEVAKLFK